MGSFNVFIGYGFDQNGPYLEVDEHNSQTIKRWNYILKNDAFTLEANAEKYCTGSFNLELLEGSPCQEQVKLENTTNSSCYTCFDKTGFNPSFYHMAKSDISPQQRAYNNTKHIVYLAYFTDGLIKVGISSDRRKEVRWVEQGARVVAHILTCENAYEARYNEELISKQLKLPEVVLGKKKRSILRYRLDENSARGSLNDLISTIQSDLEIPLHTNRIYNLELTYNPKSILLHQTIIDLSEETQKRISGTFVGLYGDILVVENDHKQFMYSLKKMIGHHVEIADGQEKNNFQPQQITLF